MQINTNVNAPFTVYNADGNEQYTTNGLYETMFCEAERLFGRRDTKYKFLGIKYHDEGPDIYFPIPNQFQVFEIRLCPNFVDSICYQLAQEILHSLVPQRKEDTTIFEEGLSIYFALHYIKKTMKLNWTPTNRSDYEEAYQSVKLLKNRNSSSFRMLKKIREQEESSFSKLNASQLRRIFPNSTPDDRKTLMGKFYPPDESEDTPITGPLPQADNVL